MESIINQLIIELKSTQINSNDLDNQFEWFILKTQTLILTLKEAKVNPYFISKLDYLPKFLSEQKKRNDIISKEWTLKLIRKDLIAELTDNYFRSVYLNIPPLNDL